jgi:hypothetical protein
LARSGVPVRLLRGLNGCTTLPAEWVNVLVRGL